MGWAELFRWILGNVLLRPSRRAGCLGGRQQLSSVSTVIRWVRQLRQTGSVAPGKMDGYKPKAIAGEHRVCLLAQAEKKDLTVWGLVAELAGRGLKVDYRSVWNFVHAEKLSFKKTVVASERDRPDIARRRAQ